MRRFAALPKVSLVARLVPFALASLLIVGCDDATSGGNAAQREYRDYMDQQYDDYQPFDGADHYATYQAEYSEARFEEAERQRQAYEQQQLEELIEAEVDRQMCERYGDCG